VTYLASFRVTSSPVPTTPPTLTIGRGRRLVVVAGGGDRLSARHTPALLPAAWVPSGLTPTVDGDLNKVTVTAADATVLPAEPALKAVTGRVSNRL
jgi:hypothetical protein